MIVKKGPVTVATSNENILNTGVLFYNTLNLIGHITEITNEAAFS
jgi:hypothetical protein